MGSNGLAQFGQLFPPDSWLVAGYIGLFVISFVAATLAPIGSEVVVTGMVIGGYEWWVVLLIATIGNSLGSLTNYFVGLWGADFVFSRWIAINPQSMQQAQAFYRRWGAPALFFAWAPIIGDALTVVSGIFRLNLLHFSCWVVLGKFTRYLLLIGLIIWWH